MADVLLISSFLFAVIFVTINGITQLFYAQSLGYRLKPTAFAYFLGAFGNIITGNVVPISAQAETITLSGLIKNIRVRVGALLFAAIVGIILGLTNSISHIVNFSGEIVMFGMMAGVGLILGEVGINMAKKSRRVGLISIITAILIWILSKDVVYTIAGSVVVSTIDFAVIRKKRVEQHYDEQNDMLDHSDWHFWKKEYWKDFKIVLPKVSLSMVFGGLSIVCLNIGTNISFGTITANMADQKPKLDTLTFINSLADIPSVLFGGIPIEAIISGTGGASWPVTAGIVMMLLSGVLIMIGVISIVAKYIPAESIAGFLLIIGFALTLIPNLLLVSESDSPLEGIVSASVTMITKNAFFGVCAGIVVKLSGSLGGIV
ncbi:MAG: xanthine/uracil permease [bacterium]